MLIPGSQLINIPVLSLQTGAEIARTSRFLINPDNLFIVAFELTGSKLEHTPAFLRIEDIREISDLGIIIDSSDEIAELDDIITLKNLYEKDFEIYNLKVIDENHEKLGKVDSIVVNPATFIIQQLNIRRPLIKSLGDTEILIHRGQVVNVTNKEITVKSTATKINQTAGRYSYINPFRTPRPSSSQPETSSTNH